MDLNYPIWLNEEFVQKVFRLSEKDETIEIISLKLSPATKQGDNFGSSMIRVNVKFKSTNNVTTSKSLIVKVQPQTDLGYLSSEEIFETEGSMMMDTLGKMNQLLSDGSALSAKGLYWQKENPAILVLEDLTPQGFQMIKHGTELDSEHLILTIRNLARFHASSCALGERDSSAIKKYKTGLYHANQRPQLWTFFERSIRNIAKVITDVPKLGPKYAEKLAKLQPHVARKTIQVAAPKEDEFNVLCHGDLWSNNMLYRYNDHGKPIEHKFVDFQVSFYTSPAVDIYYIFGTSLRDDAKQEDLLFEYHATLKSTMSRLNCRTAIPSLEELKMTLRDRAFFEVVATLLTLPIVLQTEEVEGLDNTSANNEDFELTSVRSKVFLDILERRMPHWDAAGLLDVE